ncbi:MAG: hypothetical protein H6807_06550 [Planctomycetes bacterium]|nr:hypothetical protein [Planctomycetota bacterium]
MNETPTQERPTVAVWAGSRFERGLSIVVPAGILLVPLLDPTHPGLFLLALFYLVIGRIFWGRVTVSGDRLSVKERRVLRTRSHVAQIKRIVPIWRRHNHRVPKWRRLELKESEAIEGLLFESEKSRDDVLVHSGVVSNRLPTRRARISEKSLLALIEELEPRFADQSEDGRRRWIGAHESEPDFQGIKLQRLLLTRNGILSWFWLPIIVGVKILVILCIR